MKKICLLLLIFILYAPSSAFADLKGVLQNPNAVLVTGNFTSGNCVQFANSGSSGPRISDAGAACGSGSGGSPGGSLGQIQYNAGSNTFGGLTLTGDCTLVYTTGAITCTKTNGVSFASSATTDTTNASNISSGTLSTSRLPSPFTSGTISGNTSKFVTTTGTLTTNDCAKWDLNGNLIDAGACGAGGVTSVATDSTLTGGPITSTGTLGINLANANTWTAQQMLQPASNTTIIFQVRTSGTSGTAISPLNLSVNPTNESTINAGWFNANYSFTTSFVTTNTMNFGIGRSADGSTTGQDTYSPSTAVNTGAANFRTTFSPSASSPNYAALQINPTISGTSSGTATDLAIASKTNTLTGGTVNLIDAGTTTTDFFTGYASKFKVDLTGQINSQSLTASQLAGTDASKNITSVAVGTGLSLTGGTLSATGGGGGVSSFTGDGVIISNSASTGAVTDTLVAATAKSVLGNATASSAAPTYTTAPVVSGLSTAADFNATTGATGYELNGINGISYPSVDSTANATIAIGSGALSGISTSAAYQNTVVGYQAMHGTMTTASVDNTVMGYLAGNAITSGNNNVLLGANAGLKLTSGSTNTAIGENALDAATTDGGNIAIGRGALSTQNGAGSNAGNIAIGNSSGSNLTNGSSNTILGSNVAGLTLQSGIGNIFIGVSNAIDSAAASTSNSIRIGGTGGAWLDVTGTNTVSTASTIAHGVWNMPNLSTSSAATTGTVCWATSTGLLTVDTTTTCLLSLEELKDKHGEIENALDMVEKIKPFWFTWKKETPEYAGDKHEQPGMGAHQVEGVDSRLAAYTPDGKLKGVRYQEMTAVLVKAVQEQQAEIEDLKKEIKLLKNN